MQGLAKKITIEHFILFLALFIGIGTWAVAVLPLAFIEHDLKKHKFIIALVVVVCLDYSFGKEAAHIQNRKALAFIDSSGLRI